MLSLCVSTPASSRVNMEGSFAMVTCSGRQSMQDVAMNASMHDPAGRIDTGTEIEVS